MSLIDWSVFVLFLVYVVWDGARRGLHSRDLEGYFVGNRSIPWWAAGLSVMATQASAITVIGTTGQGHEGGMDFVQTYYGLPLAMVLLCVFLIPLLRKNPILTAYEYLEGRFGPETRTLASGIFLVSRCLALGAVIYAPAVVLSTMTGFNLLVTVLVMGLLTTAYTMMGGVSAVIWTDVKQMSVIFVGLFICLGILIWKLLPEMGVLDMFHIMGASGKLNALETHPASWDLIPNWKSVEGATPTFWEDRYNLWSGLLGGLFLMLAYFGCDQSQAQRLLTSPSVDESRKTLLLSAFAKIPMQVMILLIGALLYLFHVVYPAPLLFNPDQRRLASEPQHAQALSQLEERYRATWEKRRELALQLADAEDHPLRHAGVLSEYQGTVREIAAIRTEASKELADGGSDTNYIFPQFILAHLPPVLLGLLVAAIFAAAMSSIDSVLNSLSAASVVDFYKRWLRPQADEREALRVSRITTAFWGLVATLVAFQFAGGGSIVEQINRVGSFFYGSLLGVFVLAILCPRAGRLAGFWGLVGGMTTVILVHNLLKFEFLWYNIIGCLGVLATGFAVSLLESRRPSSPGDSGR